jgi:hypothetical protein
MTSSIAPIPVFLCAAVLAATVLAGPAAAYHEKREGYEKQPVIKKKTYVRPSQENWFTCRYNCGDPLRREGLDWWQSRAEQRDGGNVRKGK